jgi:hypothetical protein
MWSTRFIFCLLNLSLLSSLTLTKAHAQNRFQNRVIDGLKLKVPSGWKHQVDKSGQVPMIILTQNPRDDLSPQVIIFSVPLHQGLKTTRLFAERLTNSILPNARVVKRITLPHGNQGREVVGKREGRSLRVAWISLSLPHSSKGISLVSISLNKRRRASKKLNLLTQIAALEIAKSEISPAGAKLVGVWDAPGMSVTLNRDGSQEYTLQGQREEGHWWVERGTLYLAFKDTTYYYYYRTNRQTLHLSDQRGNAITLRRVQPGAPKLKNSRLGGKPLTYQQARSLVKHYERMDPDQVARLLARWPKPLAEMLWYLDSLTDDMWWRICHGSYASSVRTGGGCAKMAETRRGIEELMNAPYDNHNARVQSQQMQTYISCKTGKISASSCGAYWAGQTSVSNTIQGMVQESIHVQSKCIEYVSTTGVPLGCF